MAAPQPADPRFAAAKSLFFVIGAQKAGTTWLHRYCQAHPEVCTTSWKECNYWSVLDGGGLLGQQLEREEETRKTWLSVPYMLRKMGILRPPLTDEERTVDHLLQAHQQPGPPHRDYADALFLNSDDKTRATGEVSPQYVRLSAEMYRTLYELNPTSRFIYILRDPVSRCISAKQHQLRGWVENAGFVETETAEQALLEDIENPNPWLKVDTEYDETIDRLERYVPASNILYLFFEDLFQQTTIDRFCDFIGVRRHPADFGMKVNTGGDLASRLPDSVRAALANHWAHIYRAMAKKFDGAVPAEWQASAALITSGRTAHV